RRASRLGGTPISRRGSRRLRVPRRAALRRIRSRCGRVRSGLKSWPAACGRPMGGGSTTIRNEVTAAYAMGIMLPLLETLRRRTNFETISGYVDDYIAGALLLYAAYAVT